MRVLKYVMWCVLRGGGWSRVNVPRFTLTAFHHIFFNTSTFSSPLLIASSDYWWILPLALSCNLLYCALPSNCVRLILALSLDWVFGDTLVKVAPGCYSFVMQRILGFIDPHSIVL